MRLGVIRWFSIFTAPQIRLQGTPSGGFEGLCGRNAELYRESHEKELGEKGQAEAALLRQTRRLLFKGVARKIDGEGGALPRLVAHFACAKSIGSQLEFCSATGTWCVIIFRSNGRLLNPTDGCEGSAVFRDLAFDGVAERKATSRIVIYSAEGIALHRCDFQRTAVFSAFAVKGSVAGGRSGKGIYDGIDWGRFARGFRYVCMSGLTGRGLLLKQRRSLRLLVGKEIPLFGYSLLVGPS